VKYLVFSNFLWYNQERYEEVYKLWKKEM